MAQSWFAREDTRRARLLLGVACVALFSIVGLVWQAPLFWVVDLPAWGIDWLHISNCVNKGTGCTDVSKFPAGYLLNSWAVMQGNASGVLPKYTVLSLNLLFLSLPVAMMAAARGLAYARWAAPIYLAALLASPLPAFYIHSGALEIQSGVSMGLFLAALVLASQDEPPSRRAPVLGFLFAAGMLFPLFKDTNLPVVLLSVAIVFVGARWSVWRRITGQSPPRMALPTGGVAIGSVTLALFAIAVMNRVKYGQALPAEYLAIRDLTAPTLLRSAEFLIATTFSPAGGVVVFWALAVLVTVLFMRWARLRASPLAVLISALLFGGFLAGNALWWVSFGWFSWGNRFMVPAAVASLVCIICTAHRLPDGAASEARPVGLSISWPTGPLARLVRRVALVLALIACVSSFYYVSVSYYSNRWESYWAALNAGPACERMDAAREGEMGQRLGLRFWKTDLYYACARERFFHVPRFIPLGDPPA